MKQKQTINSRNYHAFCAIAAITFCLVTTNVSADAATDIPETINLNLQANHADIAGLPKDKKSVNNFMHTKHASEYIKGYSEHAENPFTDDFTCAACHIGAKTSVDITGTPAQERVLTALNSKGGPKKLKNYFHGICLNCHKSMKKAKLATGPTKCKDCHSRN